MNQFNLKEGDKLYIVRGGMYPSKQYEEIFKITKKYIYVNHKPYYTLKVDPDNLQVLQGLNLRGYKPTVFLSEEEYINFCK